jgi:hypothetical protein
MLNTSSSLETRLGEPLACITQRYEPSKPIHFWGSGGDLADNFSARPREAYIMSVQLVLHIGMTLFMLWTGSGWRQFSVGRENVEISGALLLLYYCFTTAFFSGGGDFL